MNNSSKPRDNHNADGASITIMRTPQFFQIAQTLSDFIRDLPLDRSANDQLVSMMVEQVRQAEQGAFAYGFCKGVEFERHEQSLGAAKQLTITN